MIKPEIKAILDQNLAELGGLWRIQDCTVYTSASDDSAYQILLESPYYSARVCHEIEQALPDAGRSISVRWEYWSG